MGVRGPAKTPVKLLKMRGSALPASREDEPEPSRERPRCPTWLRLEAKRIWRRLIPQIEAMGILGQCDRLVLARYCQAFAKWMEAEEFLAKNGDMYAVRDKNGSVTDFRQYPQVNTAIRLSDHLLRIEKEFGLTAAARANLVRPKAKDPHENRGKGRFFQPREVKFA